MNIVDISDHRISNAYSSIWNQIASKNSEIYDILDGESSVYRCKSIESLKVALSSHVHRSKLDSQVNTQLNQIQGFLVDWPMHLMSKENLNSFSEKLPPVPVDIGL